MGPFITSTLLTALSAVSLVHAAPADRKATWNNLARDQATLTAFAKTITADPQGIKKNWTAAGNDVCNYAGVVCEKHPKGYQAVALLKLNGFGLGDNLQLGGLLDKLVDLTVFHANGNSFTGSVPDVSKLKTLYELDLSDNKLSGPFPTHVLDAPLTVLDLRFNQFSGPLPDALFTKTDMDLIFLNNNQFSGPIPPTANTKTLFINLANNQLSGEIPASLGNNKDLKEIVLLNNQLTGNIPEALCGLKLDILDVSDNAGLTGKLGPKCKALFDRQALVINGTSLTF